MKTYTETEALALRDAAVAEEREACARVAEAAAAQHRTREGDDSHDARVARYAAAVLRDVAADIHARAPQEPPQRPEAARDGATPAPDAPSPAGCLPVAAAGVCGARGEAAR